jgi:hypothetical protein
VQGVVIQSDLPTPSTPPRFDLSGGATGDPNNDWRLALTGNLGRQDLAAVFQSVKQHKLPNGAGGPWAVEWAALQAVADALPDNFFDSNPD